MDLYPLLVFVMTFVSGALCGYVIRETNRDIVIYGKPQKKTTPSDYDRNVHPGDIG